MPRDYVYKCTACGKTEERYRNARKSRCCHADVVRLTAVIKSHLELELGDCEGERRRMIDEAAKLRSVFFEVCPESKNDDRFFEMMGDPSCVMRYVTEWMQSRVTQWPRSDLRFAFVAGVAWYEYHNTDATIWPSDRREAEAAAEALYPNGRPAQQQNEVDSKLVAGQPGSALTPMHGASSLF
jgi:hypothetical protein